MIPYSDLPSVVYEDPRLLAGLTVTIVAVLWASRGLSTRQYLVLHRRKCRLFARLDPLARRLGRPLVRTMDSPPGAADYVTTVDQTPREVITRLRPTFSPHLVATAKRRTTKTGTQWAHSQWSTMYGRDGDRWQTEVYLFRNGAETHIYAHAERAVTAPRAHTQGPQQAGDAHDRLADATDLIPPTGQ